LYSISMLNTQKKYTFSYKTFLLCQLRQRTQYVFITNESIPEGYHSQFYLYWKRIDFKFEEYLIRLSKQDRVYITKLRTSNLKLSIETRRWNNLAKELIENRYNNCDISFFINLAILVISWLLHNLNKPIYMMRFIIVLNSGCLFHW
jgi:hypothetical protein